MSNRVYAPRVPFSVDRHAPRRGRLGPSLALALAGLTLACADATTGGVTDAGVRDPDAGPLFQTITLTGVGSPEPNVFDVWGTGTDQVFLVGERGLVMRGDGQTWTVEPTPTTADLRGVWGFEAPDPLGGPDPILEVYAVGTGGTVLRRVAGAWTEETSTTTKDLRSVRGRPGQRVWAAGVDGVIASRDLSMPSGTWELEDSNTQETIHGLWIDEDGTGGAAVGNLGLVLRLEGRAWTRQRLDGLSQPFQGVWGTAPDQLWIVGLDGTILRSRGNAFDEIPGAPAVYLRRVVGLGFEDVWITAWGGTLLHVVGDQITTYNTFSDHRLEGIWATIERLPDPVVDGGIIERPRYYVVGVTGQVLIGP